MILECKEVSVQYRVYREKERLLRWTLLNLLRGRHHHETFWALDRVSFAVKPGETFGIIGENGSGKSTLLKIIAGIVKPDRGTITTRGRVSAILELGAGFQPDLTGRENVFLNGAIMGLSRADIARKLDDIIAFSELDAFIDMPVKFYSSGMYMRLGFAIAVHVDPDLLVIDEVLAVGDESFQHRCFEKINEFKRKGKTILFVSHDLGAVRKLCQRAVWLQRGKVAALGSTEKVIDHYRGQIQEQQNKDLEVTHQAILDEVKERWGTREVELTSVAFTDDKGQERYQFLTGETVVVLIEYFAHIRVHQPVFGTAIYRSDGVHINGPNTKTANHLIASIEGPGRLRQIMPHIQLLPGTYYFSAVVYDYSCKHPYDHHERLYPFTIIEGGTREHEGCVQLPVIWQHEDTPLQL